MSNKTIRRYSKRATLNAAMATAFNRGANPSNLIASAVLPSREQLEEWRRRQMAGGSGGGGRRTTHAQIIPTPPVPPIPPDPPVPPVDPLSIYDDEFDGPTVNPLWTQFLPDVMTLSEIVGGQYRLGAIDGGATGSFWFDAFDGILQGPIITGDCQMTVRMRPYNYAGDDVFPISQFRIVGISAHDPDMTMQNYVHIGLGTLAPDPLTLIEMKNTSDNVSTYPSNPWPADVSSELRITKEGQLFTMESRILETDPWDLQRQVDRTVIGPPLPETLWWALMSYSNATPTDISGTYDWVRFTTPGFA